MTESPYISLLFVSAERRRGIFALRTTDPLAINFYHLGYTSVTFGVDVTLL